ncbi:substrate-binding periplasmic protein [Chitinimonas sp.]|uniref:substrate-binding periplasmic protein n=1 Tax=Chitinimonas sp. TaxID=1934313 RepID=UPI0035AD96A3
MLPLQSEVASLFTNTSGALMTHIGKSWLARLCVLLLAGVSHIPIWAAPLEVYVNEVEPYTLTKDPARRGLQVEIMEEVSRRTGLPMNIKSVPYARLDFVLKNQVADVAAHFPDGMEQCCVDLGLLISFKSQILSMAGAPITSISQLQGKTLGMPRGAFFDDRVNKDPQIRLYEIVDPFQGIKMMQGGRMDALVSSHYIQVHAMRLNNISRSEFAPPLVIGEKSYNLYARNSLPEGISQKIRNTLADLYKSGAIREIIKKYE